MPHWDITWPMTTTSRLSRNSASALSLWPQVALIIKGMEAMCSPDVQPLGDVLARAGEGSGSERSPDAQVAHAREYDPGRVG